jgi:hypothetical protein
LVLNTGNEPQLLKAELTGNFADAEVVESFSLAFSVKLVVQVLQGILAIHRLFIQHLNASCSFKLIDFFNIIL